MVVDGAGESSEAGVAENVAELKFGPEFDEIHSKYAVGGGGRVGEHALGRGDGRRVLLAAARIAFE